jgi:hypothetical protein
LHAPSAPTGFIESIPDDADHPLPFPSLQNSIGTDTKQQVDEDLAIKKAAASRSSLPAHSTLTNFIEPDGDDNPLLFPSLHRSIIDDTNNHRADDDFDVKQRAAMSHTADVRARHKSDELSGKKVCKVDLEQMPPGPLPIPGINADEQYAKAREKAAMQNIVSGDGNATTEEAPAIEENPNVNSGIVEPLGSDAVNQPAIDIQTQRPTFVSSLGNTSVTPTSLLEHDASVSVIPQAFLVEEEEDKEVAVAELVLPWWKRKMTWVAILIVALVVIVAVCLGVKYSTPEVVVPPAVMLFQNATTTAPSVSHAPSSSQIPSFQPSACVDKESVDPQDLEFVYFNLTSARCAVEAGRAAVVDIHVEEGSSYLYVVLYSLNRYGSWDKDDHFVEHLSSGNDTDLDPWNLEYDTFWDETYSVAMSGNTVVVGTPFFSNGTGAVFVYEYNDKIREWGREFDALVPENELAAGKNRRFGHYVDIDGDLAAIYSSGDGIVDLYQREGSWEKMASFGVSSNTTQIALSGNTIAVAGDLIYVYEYNRTSKRVLQSQKPIQFYMAQDDYNFGFGSMSLSDHHLAISVNIGNFGEESSGNGCYSPYSRAIMFFQLYEVLLFNRHDASAPFSLIQMLNSSDFEQGFGPSIALDHDILVVGGAANATNVFIYSNGIWDVSLVIINPDQCGADGYDDLVYISNRNALVSTYGNVQIYDIDECAAMPTTVPSSSPSLIPSTTCFFIEISVEHYHANEPRWSVEQKNISDNDEMEPYTTIPTLRPTFVAYALVGYDPYHLTFAHDRMCLEEGTYEFTIYNDPLYYNLTSNGSVIAEGSSVGYKDSTIFEIPFK